MSQKDYFTSIFGIQDCEIIPEKSTTDENTIIIEVRHRQGLGVSLQSLSYCQY